MRDGSEGTDRSSGNRSDWGMTTLLAAPEPWMDDAVCAQTDPEAWYPEKGGSSKEAKKICGGCPVTAECLDYAFDHDERFGIWGGYSERERRALKRGGQIPGRAARACALCGDTINQRGNWHYCSETCRAAAKQHRTAS